MNQVLPHALWLGHARHGERFEDMFAAGIRAVMYVAAEEAPVMPPRDLITCRFPLLDGAGNRSELIFLAISTLATLLKLHIPSLVVCSTGISRAPAVAAGALAMLHGQPPEECLKRVVQHHATDISPGFWNEVVGVLAGTR